MEYTQSQPDDESAHKKFHEKFVNGAPMPECKSESVVQRLADGSRIILIRASSEVQLGRVRTAIELMQPDIGAVTLPPNYSVLLRISAPTGSAKPGSLRLQGAVIAQPLQRAGLSRACDEQSTKKRRPGARTPPCSRENESSRTKRDRQISWEKSCRTGEERFLPR
mgnify:CR=1 FL=1